MFDKIIKIMNYFSSLLLLLLLSFPASFHETRLLTNNVLQQFRVSKTLVLTFDHFFQGKGAGDHFVSNNEPVYYHIITPLEKNDYSMFRYDLTGFSYGSIQPIDTTWCGYNNNQVFINHAVNINQNENRYKLNVKSYYRKDGHLVLYFGPIKKSINGFELYYQGHYYRYQKGLDLEKYKVIVGHTEHYLP